LTISKVHLVGNVEATKIENFSGGSFFPIGMGKIFCFTRVLLLFDPHLTALLFFHLPHPGFQPE